MASAQFELFTFMLSRCGFFSANRPAVTRGVLGSFLGEKVTELVVNKKYQPGSSCKPFRA